MFRNVSVRLLTGLRMSKPSSRVTANSDYSDVPRPARNYDYLEPTPSSDYVNMPAY